MAYDGANNALSNPCPEMASLRGLNDLWPWRSPFALRVSGCLEMSTSGTPSQSASGPGESSAPPDPALPNLGLVIPHLVVNGGLPSTLSCLPALGSLGFAAAGAGEWRAFDFGSFINPPWNGRRNGRHMQVRHSAMRLVSPKGSSATGTP